MFSLRSANINDLEDILELSNTVQFINLPPDEKIIKTMLLDSDGSFLKRSDKLWRDYYIFALEDLNLNKVIGVSMIHAQHGTEEEPHFYLKVSKEEKYCSAINTGFIHGTLKLGYETNGPTEIGGLVLHPDYRGNIHKLGKQLSYVRFLYIAMYPEKFKETIHSELMPPLDKDGNSPLWEAIGRRFLNMDYQAADVLSRKTKEFILDLYPSDTIYETLLSVEARHAIGKVGTDTAPVKKMLEKIGFKYVHEVDPFDGGPHYKAEQKDISLIKDKKEAQLIFREGELSSETFYLVELPNMKNKFNAALLNCSLENDGQNLKLITNNSIIRDIDKKNLSKVSFINF